MHPLRHRPLLLPWSFAAVVLAACGGGGSGTPAPPAIAGMAVSGTPVLVFDHTRDKQEPFNIPDAPASAWKEADGTVNLLITHFEAYRMRGPDLGHLSIDPHKIYSSTLSASQIPENQYDYHHWFSGPRSSDGVHFYTLAHSEWYACLLNGDCTKRAANGMSAQLNSWTNTVNAFVSADGGASWQLNSVGGSHVVAQTAYTWTGSPALAQKVYLQALNHSGIFLPSRLVQEGGYWYSVGMYIHRDFSKLDPAHGIYEAPQDRVGYVLLRSADFTNPNGWQAWTGGSGFDAVDNQDFQVFQPQQQGKALNTPPPVLVYDTRSQTYVLFHTLYGTGSYAVYYATSKSLASPAWSDSVPIAGTAGLVTDPAGPVLGFNGRNYPSVIDPQSAGYNFEFSSGSPWLFYATSPAQYGGDNLARDLYRVPLTVSYQ